MDRIARLKEFLASNPEDSFIQHALALEYIKLQDDQTARDLFEKLLRHDENYVGSYYHLAKLLERIEEREAALEVYEKGILKAKQLADHHAYNELRSAYEEFIDEST